MMQRISPAIRFGRPQQFRPRSLVIGPFWVAALIVMVLLTDTHRAHAIFGSNNFGHDSIAAYKYCKSIGGTECALAALGVDPIGEIQNLQLTLSYDPSLWTFDPAMSGPLCDFAAGGSPCFPAAASLGTQPLADLPTLAGTVIPGSTLSLSASGGVLTLDYTLPAPISVPTDENAFLLSFDAVTPFLPSPATATYFGTPGSYEFTQLSSACDSPCGSDTPVFGVNLSLVPAPEPSTIWVLGGSLALLGIAQACRRGRTGA